MESRDADKNFCFEHGETGERVYYDPRFAKDTDVPNVRRWKLECLNALRPAVYLGAGLVEAWDTAAEGARGKKARQETLKRVLKNAKTFVRDLSSEVLRAKELWAEDDFAADAVARCVEINCNALHAIDASHWLISAQELVYAAHTLHRLNELKRVAEEEQEKGLEAKRKLIREAKRFQGVWCRACRHKCMDQQATHCPTCGVRFTSKGVIAVGEIGSENFREQTRESRASLADSLAKSAGSRPGTAGLIEAPAEEVQPQPSVTFSLETDESTNPLQRASIESSYTYGSESVSQE
jgi:rubrerythrin